jgi:hypothetical protein|tara:strand:- start:21 stop:431 length:411 start_codon:yes stop_codon:yes gene_type:complete
MEYQITKIIIISFFSSILISLFLNTRYIIFFKKLSKNKKILLNLFIYSFSVLILTFTNYLLSLNGLTSLIIFNAAIITLIYFELALYLEKVFWDDFLGNSLPKSINMLISFVVMMNFGYFTLMFYIKIINIDYFVT